MSTLFTSMSTLTDLENELILNSSGSDVIMKKYRAYIQQQHARMKALQNAFTFTLSVVQASVIREKPFYIKVMSDKPELFSGNSYKEWTQYVWKMENQFDMNQMNDYVKNFDKVKLFFAVIFLKRKFTAQLLWNVKVRNNPKKNYIWKKYVDFLKENIKEVFTKKENNFEKYKDYKQKVNQSIRNYDAHRIALFSNLHSTMKLSSAIELQDFVLNLTQNNQNFLIEQGIENDKNVILKRLKQRKNFQRKKQRNVNQNKSDDDSNKRKKDENNFDEDGENNRRFNKNRRKNRKSGKKFKSDNSNRETVKSKKLWRWTRAEYKNIVNNNRCIGCDKSECNIRKCKNIKSDIVFFEKIFSNSKSKK